MQQFVQKDAFIAKNMKIKFKSEFDKLIPLWPVLNK